MYPVPQHRQHAVQDSDRRSRAATGAFEAKCFTVIEDGVDSSVGGDLAAVRSGYAMEARRHVMAAIVKLPASISACR